MAADLELCYLGAIEATKCFRTRSLSPVELVASLIERIEAVPSRRSMHSPTRSSNAPWSKREVRRLDTQPVGASDGWRDFPS